MKKPHPFGKYYLLERINVGGMAEVFRAKAFGVEGFERLVAVKRILPNIAEDKEFIRMFIDEAKLAVQLNHANIAQIFDLGVVDGSYYIALEHVHGRDLRAMFDRCRQLGEAMSVAEACFLVMKVCEGLDYAHNKRDQAGREINLVHRDVSPQNVLVSFEGEVKIIDFGIAKAAGKGSKTQAGILKGKFGYMSPEQVRGMPVDRRSDVFSCGIVLYELLTGERLFVGESDFSTLEKVRNVEILPPSTYNRKIPDELERIVLKALAKDVDDRYQNAIDLHDELQAFVYTAGEFYSRKDLAGQMKKTFGKEIEDETAKLESYRQLKPPPAEAGPPPTVSGRANGSKPPTNQANPVYSDRGDRKADAASRKSVPPPSPTKPPPPPALGRMTGQQAAVAAPSSPAIQTKPVRKGRGEGAHGDELSWDDDELETQIYDDPPEPTNDAPTAAPPMRTSTPGRATLPPPAMVPAQTPPPMMMGPSGGLAAAPVDAGPDLSSLVSTGRGWEPARSGAKLPPPNGAPANGTPPHLAAGKVASPLAQTMPSGSMVPPPGMYDPGLLPPSAAPVPALTAPGMSGRLVGYQGDAGQHTEELDGIPLSESTGPTPGMFEAQAPAYDPMASFGQHITGRQRAQSGGSKTVIIALALIAAAAVGVTLVVVLGSNSGSTKTTTAADDTTKPATPVQAPAGDQDTGFDLYVSPAGVSQWRFDGQLRTDRLPSRIRNIAPGTHEITIEAPAGFMSQSQHVTVEAGKSSRVEINLDAIDITGNFDSTPPGAKVTLIVDGKRQELGKTPTTSKLDPHFSYQVLFELPGYVSVNKHVEFDGTPDQKINVPLQKATDVASAGTPGQPGQPGTTVPGTTPVTNPVTNPPRNPGTTPVTNPGNPGTTPVTNPPHVDNTPKNPPTTNPIPPTTNPNPPTTNPGGGDNPVKSSGTGTLALGSKPPCDIFVDGAPTGSHTPTRLPLPVGRHKVTLVNNEFNIRESFTVDIKPDQIDRELKDYSDRLPK